MVALADKLDALERSIRPHRRRRHEGTVRDARQLDLERACDEARERAKVTPDEMDALREAAAAPMP